MGSLRQLYLHFPDLWATLRQMEEDQGRPFKHGYPGYVLEERFRREQEECPEKEFSVCDCRSGQLVLAGF